MELPIERDERKLRTKTITTVQQQVFLSNYPAPIAVEDEEGKGELVIPNEFKPVRMPGSHFSF